jgi:hypothetical protein
MGGQLFLFCDANLVIIQSHNQRSRSRSHYALVLKVSTKLELKADANLVSTRGHATHNQDWDLILKTEINLIGAWNKGNLPQGTNTIGMSRMTPRNQLIFDKSDSVRSRTEKSLSHIKTEKFRSNIHQSLPKFWLHKFK